MLCSNDDASARPDPALITKLQLHCANRRPQIHRSTTLAARGQNTLPQPSTPSASISEPEIQLFRHTKSDDTLKFPQSRAPEPRPRTRSPETGRLRAYALTGERTLSSPGRWSEDKAASRPSNSRGRRAAASSSYGSRPAETPEAIPRYLSPAVRGAVSGGGGGGGDCRESTTGRRSWKRDLRAARNAAWCLSLCHSGPTHSRENWAGRAGPGRLAL